MPYAGIADLVTTPFCVAYTFKRTPSIFRSIGDDSKKIARLSLHKKARWGALTKWIFGIGFVLGRPSLQYPKDPFARVFHHAEKELTPLLVLGYSSGRRKGRLKILSAREQIETRLLTRPRQN